MRLHTEYKVSWTVKTVAGELTDQVDDVFPVLDRTSFGELIFYYYQAIRKNKLFTYRITTIVAIRF